MEKSQFIFSVSVGISLLLVGSVIATKATVGLALLLLGMTLLGIAAITRYMQPRHNLRLARVSESSRSDFVAKQQA